MSEREHVANLIAEAIYNLDDDAPDCEDMAGAAIAALESAGYVIVRREPDEAMIEAGCNAREANEPRDKNTTATWRAMIAAQEQKP